MPDTAIADIRPVIVGSGYIAERHIAALALLGIRPLAVWSPRRESRERVAERWGTTAAESLEALLDTPGATHAHICSTPMQHEEPIMLAAQRGLTIVCEKPLAPTRDVVERIAGELERTGASLFLTFNRRMDAGIQQLRAAIADGRLGRVVSVFGSYRQQWNAAPSSRDWRFDPSLVGPSRVVTEIGSHWFDLAEFVLGQRIESVSAMSANMGKRTFDTGSEIGEFEPENEDLVSAQLRFEGGALGHVYATELAHGSFDDIELRIDGTLRSAVWSSTHPDQLTISHKVEGSLTTGLDSDTASIENCIRAIYTGTATEAGVAGLADGLSNASVMDAVRASHSENTWKDVIR
ncbi:Gfo/Idh/MocA family protein [Ruicaihuangia caeni]|uniref:Gfo/Idh/MocA family oxidoreductase n=1 Tax=Ruicaihuangia caeni TaxID=3042517 RepID=A0AAW6T8U6_9MICO|nr:Gfo/Idh/MocA family oxidoreductase [Klugiella sp. YN-L-19]MDI2098485.1 Gfo/Idh/MocA family oxidoreductase [Klugiella sp. YN-L-19]